MGIIKLEMYKRVWLRNAVACLHDINMVLTHLSMTPAAMAPHSECQRPPTVT